MVFLILNWILANRRGFLPENLRFLWVVTKRVPISILTKYIAMFSPSKLHKASHSFTCYPPSSPHLHRKQQIIITHSISTISTITPVYTYTSSHIKYIASIFMKCRYGRLCGSVIIYYHTYIVHSLGFYGVWVFTDVRIYYAQRTAPYLSWGYFFFQI